MEHTHLVKGLDYALLEKVKAEITNKEQEEEQMEIAVTTKKPEKDPESEVAAAEETMQFRTKAARNIYRTLFRTRIPERNDLFLPGRMAYVVDLEDAENDLDVPTTLIRSKVLIRQLLFLSNFTSNIFNLVLNSRSSLN